MLKIFTGLPSTRDVVNMYFAYINIYFQLWLEDIFLEINYKKPDYTHSLYKK